MFFNLPKQSQTYKLALLPYSFAITLLWKAENILGQHCLYSFQYPIDQFTAEDVAETLSDIVTNMNETSRNPSDVILISDIIDKIVDTKLPSQNVSSLVFYKHLKYLAHVSS